MTRAWLFVDIFVVCEIFFGLLLAAVVPALAELVVRLTMPPGVQRSAPTVHGTGSAPDPI